MYKKLGEAKLKSGEMMEIGVVKAPDAEHAERLHEHLEHKRDPWIWHVDKALAGELDELETRFYIGKIGEEVAANVMIVEHAAVGLLGHVFTKPHHRRKGAYTTVMAEQMKDCERRGVKLLYLGTGYDSPPYWIYHSFGFRSVAEGSGTMRFAWDGAFEKKFLSGSNPKIEEIKWRHWPPVSVLMMQPEGDYLRSITFGHFGMASWEGPFLHLKKELEEKKGSRGKVLAASNGAVVGVAMVRPDSRWKGAVFVLDLYVYPNFSSETAKLIESLDLPPAKVQCYADGESPAKMEALERCGFEREGVFARQVRRGERFLDVMIYAKAK